MLLVVVVIIANTYEKLAMWKGFLAILLDLGDRE